MADKALRQACFQTSGDPIAEAFFSSLFYRIYHLRVGMTHGKRTPRQHVIDKRITVFIGEECALAGTHEKGVAAYRFEGAYRAVHTTGKHGLRFTPQPFRKAMIHF